MNEADNAPSQDSGVDINPTPDINEPEITKADIQQATEDRIKAEAEALEAEREAAEIKDADITPEDLARAAEESKAAAEVADVAEGELGMAINQAMMQPQDPNPVPTSSSSQSPNLPPVVAPVNITNVSQNTVNNPPNIQPSSTSGPSAPPSFARPTSLPEVPTRRQTNAQLQVSPKPTTLPEAIPKKPGSVTKEAEVMTTDPRTLELQQETSKQLIKLAEIIKGLEERLASQEEARKLAEERDMIKSGQMTPLEMDERAERLAKQAQKDLEKKWWGPEYTLLRLRGFMEALKINPIAGILIAGKLLG